jgi:trehalose transport system permease protein
MKLDKVIAYILTIIVALYFIFPLYVLFLYSFSDPKFTFYRSFPILYPVKLTLNNLLYAITSTALMPPLEKSVIVATLVGIITLILTIPAAYGLTRLNENIANGIVVLLFVTNLMPSIVVAIPIASEFVKIGLYDTPFGLALAQSLITIPMSTFLLLGTFQAIPKDIELQSRVDGANSIISFFAIDLPLALPGIIAAFLISWMTSWDEFTFAALLSPIHPTLPFEIYVSVTRGNLLAALALSFLITLPVIVLTLVLQKYLKGEYLAGGLKG